MSRDQKSRVHLEGDLLDGVVEELAVKSGNLELQSGSRPRAVCAGKGTSTPWRATVDLGQVRELGKGGGVTKGNEDDAVVGERRYGVHNGALYWKP